MESRQPQFALEAPRFCCFPIRPLLIFTSAFGILTGAVAILRAGNGLMRASPGILILLDVLTFCGAFYKDETALKWSRRVVLFSIWIGIINFSIWPVLVSSMFAIATPVNGTGGYGSQMMLDFQREEFLLSSNHSHFLMALFMGYLVELFIGFYIGKFYIQYILINRLWEYVKATTIPSQPISFYNPNPIVVGYNPLVY